MNALRPFHPAVSDWFRERFGEPTEIQRLAWPTIANGENVLALAPTGSGKTLAAFLWFINEFAAKNIPIGATRVLYISPLRALNNDVHRNLLAPIEELQVFFAARGLSFPGIRVQTRSGDTEQGERRRMLLHPPEILITTPESLNILLASGAAARLFGDLRAVILDEIHATASTKRGVHLMTAVERLVPYAREFQRIALSATVSNPETIASLVAGSMSGEAWKERPIRILRSRAEAAFALEIRPVRPGEPLSREGTPSRKGRQPEENEREEPTGSHFWDSIVAQLLSIIGTGRRILCFTESRRLAEKMAALLNENQEEPIAFAHHGSLSRELRLSIEERFKQGRLPCVVATSSLELGIDIGDLDEVVLLQCPGSASRALQRLGRAGHRPGETSRGTAIPLNAADLLRFTVMRRMIEERDLEPVQVPDSPLDLLAQILLSMACEAEATGRSLDSHEAFLRLKGCLAFRDLDPKRFQLTLDLLEGRFQGLPFAELRPRLRRDENRLQPLPGARLVLYRSGGTIPDRGTFRLRNAPSGTKGGVIGELDEEFVFERKVGDRFVLGSRLWKIRTIGENDVEVEPVSDGWGMNPFWRADGGDMDNNLADRLAATLELWSDRQESDPGFADTLRMAEGQDTALALLELFQRHREITGMGLPHRHRLQAEVMGAGPDSAQGCPVFLHTFWGGRRNRPVGIALSAALEERTGHPVPYFAGDEGLLLILPDASCFTNLASLFSALPSVEFLRRLEEGLPRSSLFGAHFRQAAGIALLLPSRGFNRRTPFWLHRLAAGRLLEALSGKGEFPVTVEAWRTLLKDRFDLEGAKRRLEEIENGEIRLEHAVVSEPGPLCAGLEFQRAGDLMYRPDGSGDAGHRTTFYDELVLAGQPAVSGESVRRFEERSLRLHPSYRPADTGELLDWLSERGFLPEDEWNALKSQVVYDPRTGGAVVFRVRIARDFFIAGLEGAALLTQAFGNTLVGFEDSGEDGDTEAVSCVQASVNDLRDRFVELPPALELFERFLSWYGPVPLERLRLLFGDDTDALIEELETEKRSLRGPLIRDSTEEYACHPANLERLHREARRSARSVPPLRPLADLPLFLACHQGLAGNLDPSAKPLSREEEGERLREHLERIFGFPALASLWESDLLPARMPWYRQSLLDSLMQESDLHWSGVSREAGSTVEPGKSTHIFFFLGPEAPLFFSDATGPASAPGPEKTSPDSLLDLFVDSEPEDLAALAGRAGLSLPAAESRLLTLVGNGVLAAGSTRLLRRAVRGRFRIDPVASERSMMRRGRWGTPREVSKVFRPVPSASVDAFDREESNRQRAQLLLDRYGILFRELLQHEMPAFQWKSLYRTLCRMELAGEVLAGSFFEGLEGLQFLSPRALRILRETLPGDSLYWMNAKDPASPCGIPGLELPARQSTTRLVCRGRKPVLFLLRNGKHLQFQLPPEDCGFLVPVFGMFMDRDFDPPSRWLVERINALPSRESPYRNVLESAGFRVDSGGMVLYRR